MSEWILMTKDGEEKLVHPGNVANHERFGWERAQATEDKPVEQAEPVEPVVEPSEKPVLDEVAEPAAEEVPAVESKTEEIFVAKPARKKTKKKESGSPASPFPG